MLTAIDRKTTKQDSFNGRNIDEASSNYPQKNNFNSVSVSVSVSVSLPTDGMALLCLLF
jgi:hypothetical protein